MKARVAVFMIFFAIVSMAAVPQIIQYQGKLTDMSGIGENDTLDIRFRIFDVETGGDSLWAMTIADVAIVHGLFDVNIGPIDLPFDEQYWLEIVVDGEVLAPRVQLTSSPYAFRAAVADSFTGGVTPWTQDTMVAHWDSIRGLPDSLIEGIGVLNYIPKWLDDSTLGSSDIYNTISHIGMQKPVNISYTLTVDTILSPLDTLYIPEKVWVEELVTDSIEARSDVVKIRDALSIRDSLYFDGEWRKEWPISPTTYSVGDFAQGGVVFWVDETGQHGLVCAKQDHSARVRWYAGTDTYTMARGDGPYAGEMNTAIIIANQGYGDGGTYAARVCNEMEVTEGGKTYADWYLPSIEELFLMCMNQAIIDSSAIANGGSAFKTMGGEYWSSTEVDDEEARWLHMSSGMQLTVDKYNSFWMRPVRRF